MVVPGEQSMMKWRAHGLSDRGRRRRRNEDALLLLAESGLCAVADGMGGHAAGDVASRIAVEGLATAFSAVGEPVADALERRLAGAFGAANRAILDHAARDVSCHGMGTTLTALLPVAGMPACVLAHVGDSRAYRLRGDEFRQLTRDHTWVQQQVDAGILTAEQARHHNRASVLTRVLGTDATAPADTLVADVRPGDLFLLCSDGLTAVLTDSDVYDVIAAASALQDAARALEDAVGALVDEANRRGGPDNITVVLATPGREWAAP
jgi:PPM family protein phosphatase